MGIETNKQGIPSRSYYERPYIPSAKEASDYSSVPLLPVEAHTILVDNARKRVSMVDNIALQKISESDESDVAVDFKKVRRQVIAELGVDDDWELR